MRFPGEGGGQHVRPDDIQIDRLFKTAIDQLIIKQRHQEVQGNGIPDQYLQDRGVAVTDL